MDSLDLIYASAIALSLGAIITAFVKNKTISGLVANTATLFSSVCLFYSSIEIVNGTKIVENILFTFSPLINSSFFISIDAFSGLFLMIIAVVSLCVTLFSYRYISFYREHSSSRFYPFLLLLFLSSIGLVCTKDMLFFIVFWEMLTLNSWFLVVFERQKTQAVKGGLQYFITTHVTTAFLIIAAVVVYCYVKDFNFVEIRNCLSILIQQNPILAHFILFCFFIAFVTKAGVLPFGFWLPNTYPQAPASAASFFGGVMSKLGVYSIVRFFYFILPFSSHMQIWGITIATFGTISIFVGTTAALMQDESKRLMSFHAIGQVGYMLLGIGIGLYFININPMLATIAIIGGVFHLLNNAIYKSLLFLNAGSIFYKTATTDLNNVSGLIKVMPFTAITALIGSLSIAGVPPFNGFISKLLIFESSIFSGVEKDVLFLIKGVFIIFGIISVFISAVTLASFLKFVNSAFMGKLYGIKGDEKKISLTMNIAQFILSFLCILCGLFPVFPLKLIFNAVTASFNQEMFLFSDSFLANIAGLEIFFRKGDSQGTWFPVFVMIPLAVLSISVFLFEKYAKAKKREVETWYGGKEHTAEEVTYGGHSFYQPFKELVSFKIGKIQFKGFYPVELPLLKISFPEWIKKFLHPDEWFYYPFVSKFLYLTERLSKIYETTTKKYIFWFILGSLFIFYLIYYGGKL